MKIEDLITKEGIIKFEIGNPEIEIIQGKVHLFKNSKYILYDYNNKLPVKKF
jgi:hypothetical protein